MSKNDTREEAWELFKQAYQYQMTGELELAKQYYKKSIQTFPTAEAYTFLGWTYSFQGKYREAIEECQKAILIDADFGNPYNDIGAYLIELEKYDEALVWLERALQAKRYDSYHYPYYNMGRVYTIKEMYTRAMECFQKSLELAPEYPLAQQAVETLRRKVN